jgi:hypothetical protein
LPPFAQISPKLLRDILELDGWKATHQDDYNWLMDKDGFEPIPIPKLVRTVPFAVFDNCLEKSQIVGDRYQKLFAKASALSALA